ncbi:MAG: hypothetical protein DMD61_01305 [Gemmatimonadetes bacterium]|nr:MAG: hypothetical protein DMD61_01305 [Gemmatimonadota bacterium]
MPADPLFERLARALAGRYSLIRELGQGGMATVYLGTDQKLARRVAIKVLAPATRAYLGSDRFQREVLLAAQLSHPHIVPLFEADEADGLLFYVMEYVEGESLQDRISRKGPLPVEEAIRLTTEVGDALQYAHDTGIIHRDIKPANILLSRGHALVSDFGIAKLVEERGGGERGERSSLTGQGIAVGTAEYMSPEQASGDKRVDARSDVYGLAVVLYEMLAGEPPFTGDSVQAVVARVLGEPLRPIRTLRPSLPAHIERALTRALAKRPGDRPPTARAFIEMLADPEAGRRISKRRRAWLLVGGSAAVVALAWALWPPRIVGPPPGMVLVPGGAYPVGGRPWRDSTLVRLDSFYIDSTEVTVAAFERSLASPGGGTPPSTTKPPDGWPVTGVLWSEATAYCAARQRGGRLPTENEWEAAARGPEGLRYPWGERWQPGRANADSLHGTLAPAGEAVLGKSWVGAVDMIGNAWEWTATAGVAPQGVAGHVIKGGAFDTPPENATGLFRAILPDRRRWLAHTGFAYLAVGLTEAIITRLGRVDRLAVKSRNAVRRFQGAALDDPASVGRALGVAFLVSGSVRRSPSGLHVTAELVRAANGVHVWGAQYDRGDTALQAIETDITDAIATRITGELAPAERSALAGRATRDPATYDHFLHGTYYLAQRTPRAVGRAIREFEAAERLDSGFAPAPARIALGYALFLDWGWVYPGLPPGGVLARGFGAADRALRRDSTSADAWMARGFLLSFRNPRTFAGVEDAFRHATALDPLNAEAYHQYGMTLLWLGRDSSAAEMYRRALILEPERPITLFNLARLRMRRGDYRPAIRWLDSALIVDPAADYAYVGRLAAEIGAPGGPSVTDAAWVGRAFVALGEPARALDLLEQVRPRGARLWYYLESREFDAVRANPRFRRLAEESRPK